MKVTFLAAVAVGFALLFGGTAMAHGGPGGAVYTETNSPAGNAVHRLDRGSDGSLTPVAIYRTGGTGTGASLSSQGPVALSDDGRVLVAVNAGSNDISSFRVGRRGHLTLVARVPSGGVLPNSVDIDRGSVYVLNAAGATPNVTAFDVSGSGDLRLRGSSALTPGSFNAAQVMATPDGRALVVTVRATSQIQTFPLRFGRPGAPIVSASAGAVPFGFAFSARGDLIVSEAGASTVSSYRLGRDGLVSPITSALGVGQGAACWVAVTEDGRFAYTGNATGSISGFAIQRDGSLRALNADGITALTPRPNDLAIVGNTLYAVNPFTQEVTAYRIAGDGSLTELPRLAPLGTSLAGLAAR
jgi:6-phosphogluconolactonase (cycloisomerase 2 family)